MFIVNDDTSDEESRRTTRVGVALAVIALVIGILTAIFNFMKKIFQVIIIKNELLIGCSFLCVYIFLTLIILLVFDVLLYALGDIGRYNVKHEDYKKNDGISDNLYDSFIFDARCAGFVIYIELLVVILIYAIYYPVLLVNIFYKILFVIECVGFIIYTAKKAKLLIAKRKNILIFCLKFLFFLAIIFPWVNLFEESKISINFDNNKILIENQSSQDYDSMEIRIYNCGNGEEVSEHIVCDTELLLAEEKNKRFVEEVDGEISYSSGNSSYWIYEYDMSLVKLKPGKYNIIIDVTQGDTKLHFENQFIYNKKKIKYAKAEFVKTYK